jgi:hypothetical protein
MLLRSMSTWVLSNESNALSVSGPRSPSLRARPRQGEANIALRPAVLRMPPWGWIKPNRPAPYLSEKLIERCDSFLRKIVNQ